MSLLSKSKQELLFGEEVLYGRLGWTPPPPPRDARIPLSTKDSPFEEFNRLLDTAFNPCLGFADEVPNNQDAKDAAKKVFDRVNQISVDQISDRLPETRYGLRLERQQLESEVSHFFEKITATPDWYLTDTLMTLPLAEIKKILRSYPPSSAAALETYIRQQIPADPTIFLDDHGGEILPITADYLAQVLGLAEALPLLEDGARCALRIHVLLVECLIRYYRWYRNMDCDALFQTLRCVLEPPAAARGLIRHPRVGLDVVDAAKQCREAYFSSQEECIYSQLRGTPRCGHTESAKILQYLQMKAYNEVRTKVLLTIGTLLPADVVELLVEAALVAEGLPVDLRIYAIADGKAIVGRQYFCDHFEWLRDDENAWRAWTRGFQQLRPQRPSTTKTEVGNCRKRSRPGGSS